jgi:hypothetical protein
LRPEGKHGEYRERPKCASEGVIVRHWSLTDGKTASYRTLRHRDERNDVAPMVVSSSCPQLRLARDRRCGHCDRLGPRGGTAAVMCESLGRRDIAVSRHRAERAGEAARAGQRCGSPGAAAGVRGVDRSLRHLPTRRRKDHMLQYRDRLPGPGGGVPAQRARAGEEARELTGLFAFPTGTGSQKVPWYSQRSLTASLPVLSKTYGRANLGATQSAGTAVARRHSCALKLDTLRGRVDKAEALLIDVGASPDASAGENRLRYLWLRTLLKYLSALLSGRARPLARGRSATFLLDANISEIRQARPSHPKVDRWFAHSAARKSVRGCWRSRKSAVALSVKRRWRLKQALDRRFSETQVCRSRPDMIAARALLNCQSLTLIDGRNCMASLLLPAMGVTLP